MLLGGDVFFGMFFWEMSHEIGMRFFSFGGVVVLNEGRNIYVYMYIYIYIHTHTHMWSHSSSLDS